MGCFCSGKRLLLGLSCHSSDQLGFPGPLGDQEAEAAGEGPVTACQLQFWVTVYCFYLKLNYAEKALYFA